MSSACRPSQYLPFAFFNLLNPLVALAYAFTGFRIEHVPVAATPAADDTPAAGVDDPPALIPEGDGHVD